MKPIKLFEMFAGYGGASFALKKANIPFECVGYSEIDKYAIQCYTQNHPNITNYGDATKINPNDLPNFDLLTGGYPCQSFSICGKGMGEQDTRGTLFHEIIRIAEVKQPKYMLLENVKGLTFKKHKDTFNKILSELDRIGYNVRWEILNSKDYGTPQSRNRVWFVCIRKDLPFAYVIPQESPMKLFKDILEKEVDEKYYLTEHQKDFINYKYKQGKRNIKSLEDRLIEFPAYSQCLKTGSQKKYILEATIFDDGKGARVLTPKECWRLMGFFNDEINVGGISDTQQYKLAGNGWDINIVSKILTNLIGDE